MLLLALRPSGRASGDVATPPATTSASGVPLPHPTPPPQPLVSVAPNVNKLMNSELFCSLAALGMHGLRRSRVGGLKKKQNSNYYSAPRISGNRRYRQKTGKCQQQHARPPSPASPVPSLMRAARMCIKRKKKKVQKSKYKKVF